MHMNMPERALSLYLSNPSKSISLASAGLSQQLAKLKTFCFPFAFPVLKLEDKAYMLAAQRKYTSAFLYKDEEQMSWELYPFLPLLPAVPDSWGKALSNSSGDSTAVWCNTAWPCSAPSPSKIREAARVMNVAGGHGGETRQEPQCGRWHCTLQMKDALEVWAFSNPLRFCLPPVWYWSSAQQALVLEECVIVLLPL